MSTATARPAEHGAPLLAPGTSTREAAHAFLGNRLSRRAFLAALTGAGVCAPAAAALATALDGGAPGAGRGRELRDLSGGELMAEILRDRGVRYVFGLGGSEEVGFLDALVDRVDLHYALALHEGTVMAMADGYARISGHTAVVNLHSIAGAGYALGPMVNAFKDHTPVVITVGRQSTGMRGSHAFLEAPNLHLLARDYSRWTWDVLRADSIPETLHRAFTLARLPPSGPVFLTFSKDLWETPVATARLAPDDGPAVRFVPDSAAIGALADALLSARAPLIVAGRELARHGGTAELVTIAEALGAPVMSDVPASHSPITFPTDHPLYAGLFTAEADFPARMDLFWSVGGTMFTLFRAPPAPLIPPAVTSAHLSTDAAALGRNQQVDIPLLGHSGETLRLLVEALQARRPPSAREARRDRIARHHRRRRERLDAAAARVWDDEPIAPERLAVELNRALPADAIVVTELATSDPYVWRYLDFHQTPGGRVHVTSAGGCLGWGLGAAIGARIAAPERCVAVLVGDGSFQFGVQALWSAARYEVPVAIVIWNNVAYQANRTALHRYGGRAAATGKYIGCHLGVPEIDHVRIAAGYGVDGERVTRPSALPAAIARCLGALGEGRAYVLDVRIQRRGADSDWYGAFSVARRLPRQS